MPYRLVYIGLGLLVVASVVLGVVLSREGIPAELPGPIESVTPAPGSSGISQTTLEIDLEVGYEAAIFVDGLPIPTANFVPATGVYTWSPSPTSPVITEWSPGEHTVVVEWERVAGAPDFGSYEWTFRIQS